MALSSLRADESVRSQRGEFPQLTSFQLSCRLGDHKMFQHIMRRRTSIVWKWGPATQYQVDVAGIDSAFPGFTSAMELMCALDASKETQEFLLDSFDEGFIQWAAELDSNPCVPSYTAPCGRKMCVWTDERVCVHVTLARGDAALCSSKSGNASAGTSTIRCSARSSSSSCPC